MHSDDLRDDTMMCYREARRLSYGLPITLLFAVYLRFWILGEPITPTAEVIAIFGAALLYVLGEVRCEIIRSDIRKQRQVSGF